MIILLFFISLLIVIPAYSQTSFGIEAQAYPAGIIPGLRFNVGILEKLNLTSRIGYNFTDRRDWGENDKEEGGGPGFSGGLERTDFLTENLSLHVRADLWFMDIDWEQSGLLTCDPVACPDAIVSGSTRIIVFQPTFGISHLYNISEQFFIKPSLSFGWEINVKTDGRDVGEGAILLAGFQFGRIFK